MTSVDWPAERLPLPDALSAPELPVTLHFTGPPFAVTVTLQLVCPDRM
jgi:hypothetical protein